MAFNLWQVVTWTIKEHDKTNYTSFGINFLEYLENINHKTNKLW